MPHSIKVAAQKFNITAYTLRYYDKMGLLPFVNRDNSGNRIFTNEDYEWLSLIICLKDTGMPLKKIKEYIALCMDGCQGSAEQRHSILLSHRQDVIRQIADLEQNLTNINKKIGGVLGEKKIVL